MKNTYHLLQDTEECNYYTIINFEKRVWITPIDRNIGNWKNSLPKIFKLFNSQPITQIDNDCYDDDDDDDEGLILMENYETVEEFCQALTNDPYCVSARVIATFTGKITYKEFTKQFPELLI